MKIYIILLGFFLYGCDQASDSHGVNIDSEETVSESVRKEYYENGNIKSTISINELGQYHGEAKQFYPSGALLNRTYFKNGNRVGENIVYFENTNVKFVEHYNDKGRLHGEFMEYFENGQLKLTGEYIDGEKEGLVKEYFEDGTIYQINNYSSDVFHGLQKVFHPNGQLALTGTSEKGLEEGDWLYLDLNGDTLKIESYHLGELKNKIVYKESWRYNE